MEYPTVEKILAASKVDEKIQDLEEKLKEVLEEIDRKDGLHCEQEIKKKNEYQEELRKLKKLSSKK